MNNPTVLGADADEALSITPGTPESRNVWQPIAHCAGSANANINCGSGAAIEYYQTHPGDLHDAAPWPIPEIVFRGNVYEVDVERLRPAGLRQSPSSFPGSYHLEHTRYANQGLSQYVNEGGLDTLSAIHLFSLPDPITGPLVDVDYFEARADWNLVGRCQSGTNNPHSRWPF